MPQTATEQLVIPDGLTRYLYKKRNPNFARSQQGWDKAKIGRACGKLMENLMKSGAKNRTEWETYYLTRVKKPREVVKLAERLMAVVPRLSLQDAITIVLIHAVDETWNGYLAEKKALEAVSRFYAHLPFITVRHATAQEDTKFAIDLVVEAWDTVVFGIQVKPISYFRMKGFAGRPHYAKVKNSEKNRQFLALHPHARVAYLSTDSTYIRLDFRPPNEWWSDPTNPLLPYRLPKGADRGWRYLTEHNPLPDHYGAFSHLKPQS